jgi:hypothetical protein
MIDSISAFLPLEDGLGTKVIGHNFKKLAPYKNVFLAQVTATVADERFRPQYVGRSVLAT